MTVAEIRAELALLEEELRVALNPHAMTATEEKIYTQVKLNLGKHLTLDEAVPAEVGCAEAVSKVLSLSGINVPPQGISGTYSLYEWLDTNSAFQKIDEPEQGAILISPTGMGDGSVEGHVGIFCAFNLQWKNDWAIASNDSASGNFLETWSWQRWQAYYEAVGKLPCYIFRAL